MGKKSKTSTTPVAADASELVSIGAPTTTVPTPIMTTDDSTQSKRKSAPIASDEEAALPSSDEAD
jgi:hypothetical protein